MQSFSPNLPRAAPPRLVGASGVRRICAPARYSGRGGAGSPCIPHGGGGRVAAWALLWACRALLQRQWGGWSVVGSRARVGGVAAWALLQRQWGGVQRRGGGQWSGAVCTPCGLFYRVIREGSSARRRWRAVICSGGGDLYERCPLRVSARGSVTQRSIGSRAVCTAQPLQVVHQPAESVQGCEESRAVVTARGQDGP